MHTQSKTILVICNNHNSLAILDLCQSIVARLEGASLIIVSSPDLYGRIEALCNHLKNITLIKWGQDSLENPPNHVITSLFKKTYKKFLKTKFFKMCLNWFRHTSPGFLLQEYLIYFRLVIAKKRALYILDDGAPTAIMTFSDRTHDYLEASILWAAKKRSIKIIIPYIAHYDKDYAIAYRKNSNGHVSDEFRPFYPFNFYKIYAYTRLRKSLYKNIFFQSPHVLMAHRKAGTLSTYPWWVGNGNSDYVCVDSLHSMKRFSQNHVLEKKLKLVGDVYYDALNSQIKNKDQRRMDLCTKYQLDSARKIVILAMPQFSEQGLMDAPSHWSAISLLMAALSNSGHNILVSLHPRMNSADYMFLEEEYPCKITEERLSEYICIGDFFVSHCSSTVIWATLSGVRAIVIDLLSIRPDFYSFLKTVQVVKNFNDLTFSLSEQPIFNEADFHDDWLILSKDDIFDGKTIDRYVALLLET